MTTDEFAALADFSLEALTEVVDADWTTRAGVLEWTCWQAVDHLVDCLLSYALPIGARAESGFLPFEELHATAEATPWVSRTGRNSHRVTAASYWGQSVPDHRVKAHDQTRRAFRLGRKGFRFSVPGDGISLDRLPPSLSRCGQ